MMWFGLGMIGLPLTYVGVAVAIVNLLLAPLHLWLWRGGPYKQVWVMGGVILPLLSIAYLVAFWLLYSNTRILG